VLLGLVVLDDVLLDRDAIEDRRDRFTAAVAAA
jgi:hypothetical protein